MIRCRFVPSLFQKLTQIDKMQPNPFMKCLEFLTNQERTRNTARSVRSLFRRQTQRLTAWVRLQSNATGSIQHMVANRHPVAIYCGEQIGNQDESLIRR